MTSARHVGSPVCFSFDVDWAPEPVLEDLVDLVGGLGVKATLFATHDSPTLRSLAPDRFEIGIHPRITRIEGFREAAAPLLAAYPGARSTRSHSVTTSARFYAEMVALGLRYSSNYVMSHCAGLRPVLLESPELLHELPVFFSDYGHLIHSDRQGRFATDLPDLSRPGMRVFCFHPIHLYLNTHTLAQYQAVRGDLQAIDRLEAARDLARPGVRTLFLALARAVAAGGHPVCRIDELVGHFAEAGHGA